MTRTPKPGPCRAASSVRTSPSTKPLPVNSTRKPASQAPAHLAQLGRAYGEPGHEPRTNVVTVAYLAVTPDVGQITAGSDAANAKLWPVVEALDSLDLAFDHKTNSRRRDQRATEQLEQTDSPPPSSVRRSLSLNSRTCTKSCGAPTSTPPTSSRRCQGHRPHLTRFVGLRGTHRQTRPLQPPAAADHPSSPSRTSWKDEGPIRRPRSGKRRKESGHE